ncbi:MAG: LEA type 2 family protein [Holophagaceae bacterium]|nr:LEA type 2 family protein [Holophagaceae bacterium]
MRFRQGFLAVLVAAGTTGLALLPLGCSALNPALRYEEAARQLRFSLDRVEPKLELVFPLEQSRLRLRLDVGVDNPTDQRLRTRKVSGDLRLKVRDEENALGTVTFPEGADIVAKGRSTLKVEVLFSQKDLQAAWSPLSRAVLRHDPATWTITGEARFELLGIEFGVPFRAHRESGD